MGVLTQVEEDLIQERFDDLLNNCTRCNDESERELIIKAFNFAKDAHKDMRRKSGEPYIIHPLAVAKIVTFEMGLGAKSIACSFLHDVVEDTDYTIDDIEYRFGKKVAVIVAGLTKISGVIDGHASMQAENFRRMLLTLSDDVRVILIKLADRLHNMRTLESLPLNKQIKIAGETMYMYAPLAHRMGLYAIKTELEDLSLKFRHPTAYYEISSKLAGNEKKRQAFINKFAMPIIERLVKNNITFDINGRPKSVYSIWHKMQTKKVEFEEIYDLFAIRIIFDHIPGVPEKTQCWNIYSMITDIYMPKPDRIRDWVSTPKANGYEALHATVMGPDGNWVEVQIRTRRMDEIAERGFAAHWKYKQTGSTESELDKWLKRIRDLLESPNADALEFLDDFKLNLFATEIFVFTPKGLIKTMPKGSTALDFAYEIHSEIGNKAIGAKVNYQLKPLTYVINSGDQIEIITSENSKPNRDWLNIAITAKAKASIKQTLKAETKNRIEKGKQILEEKLADAKLKPNARVLQKLIPEYHVATKEELYSKIGSGIIDLEDLKKILKRNSKNKWIRYWDLQFLKSSPHVIKDDATGKRKLEFDTKNQLIIREEVDQANKSIEIARCCSPIPGDQVIGYLKDDGTVEIHKSECSNALKIMSSHGDKIVSAKWTIHKVLSFLVKIGISGFERFGVYNSITNIISKELKVNIRNINLASHDGIFEGTIDIYVHSTKDLNNLIMNLMKIKGVDSVYRVESQDE